ncbi:glycosyltransferase [Roseicyclus persicicus]|uniref:Glycosyltransferase n=1 Tax=Roseicyclus persicicus TaxID=2650661 RepID=A0A7X6H1J2_9RHOB|nr:glycosyltransferase [Roseibacterium persicicum]NKX45443.1 glycosyltransferase [Roseibacterium persicicum]
MTLTDLVESAILSQGDLFIHAAPTALADGLGVVCGGRPVPLEVMDDDVAWPADLPFRKAFVYPEDGAPLDEQLFDGTPVAFGSEAYVNALPDWAVDNGRTLQMRVDGVDEPHLIGIDVPIVIPAGVGPGRFEALVAAHRCDVALVVRFDPGPGGKAETVEVRFDPAFGGGQSPAGYQQVSLASPFRDTEVTVTMAVRHLGYRSDGSQDDPYVFIANAEVIAGNIGRGRMRPRHRSVGDGAGGAWFRAPVTPFLSPNDAPLALSLGDEQLDIFGPEQNELTLVDDYGHSLVLKARAPMTALLHVDGAPVDRIEIRTDDTFVRLPTALMRGEIVTVSVRDLSGSQVFLTLPVLAPRMLTPAEVLSRESRAPFPTDLTVRANHRYRGLRAHLDHPVPGLDPASLSTAIQTLDRTFDTLKLKPIAFPEVEDPKVSVVIPAHNKVEVTYYGLCALLVAHNRASFEVIVVDDASTDETAELETIVSGIRVVRNTEAQRFIRACNAGVAASRGEYVVLLNNDTEPTVGWLDALIDAFERFENVGLVGSKLLYPDGSLQDAGGIVWGSGNPWNYGHRANPWDPRFCYARQADYLSGAALMTTRAIWDHVGGLSDYLEPMYFEDTDLAFKVREAGFTTWFVPSSVVYHFEGMTSGTDTSSGFKRYQEVNRPKFKRRWARAYAGFGKEGQQPDLEKDRGIVGRVLFIDYGIPREDRDAGSYAARREIELVQSLGYKVTFLPQNLAHLGSYTEELERSGVEVIRAPFYLSVAEFLEKRAAEFDAVYITRYYVAQETIPHIRRWAPEAKIILNNADLHFLRELRSALGSKDPARIAAVRQVREKELEMMRAADLVLSYNEVEHSVILSHTDGQARVMTCPWVVEIPEKVPALKGRKGMSFLGNYGHPPNAEGVIWFCTEVMPMLEGTDAHLSIYGSGMGADIKALASDMVDPAGFIEEVSDAYDRHRIFIAPLLSGAGIKGKVLSALAHGIPTILTPVAAEGIGLRSGHDSIIVETPQDWADAILRLSEDDKLWTAMSKAARAYAADRFSFEAGRLKIKAAFEAVDLFGAM